nr:hypothetical protein [uncultured Mediterraneibacter sp.]
MTKQYLEISHWNISNPSDRIFQRPDIDIPDEYQHPGLLMPQGANLDDVQNAVRTIYDYLVKHKIYAMRFELGDLEWNFLPRKKMTLSEIEEKLGYPIELVEEKGREDNE